MTLKAKEFWCRDPLPTAAELKVTRDRLMQMVDLTCPVCGAVQTDDLASIVSSRPACYPCWDRGVSVPLTCCCRLCSECPGRPFIAPDDAESLD